jgi:WD40 repeat protein
VVKLWDLAGRREIAALDAHRATVTALVFSEDGGTLCIGTADGVVELWGINHRQLRDTLNADERAPITAIRLASGGSALAAGNETGDITVWDLPTPADRKRFRAERTPVREVSFSPGGRLLVAVVGSGAVVTWDLGTGLLRDTHQGPRRGRGVVATTLPGNERVILASADHSVIDVRMISDGGRPIRLAGHTGTVRCLAFHPDGWTLVSGSEDQTIRVWDLLSELTGPSLLK